MTTARRWCLVALGVALLLALPVAIGALPARDSDVTAARLLERVKASGAVTYSGYAESQGGLQLPLTDRFTDVADLLGQRTRLRVWWRGTNDWRVDAIDAAGETDLIHDAGGTTTWDYESDEAIRTNEPNFRLPRSADLLPSELGRRLLQDAAANQVTRIPPDRIAGRDAPGIRLTPSEPRTTVDHVDVWVDPDTGLPLRVSVYGKHERAPAMSTTFVQVSTQPPAASDTAFVLPPGAEMHFEDTVDIASAADQFAPVTPPDQLAGLHRRVIGDDLGAVGTYGRGVTLLVAVPLWDDAADPLRDQLVATPGARIADHGTTLTVGPLSLLLTPEGPRGLSWLLSGSVTVPTLTTAATELAENPPVER